MRDYNDLISKYINNIYIYIYIYIYIQTYIYKIMILNNYILKYVTSI